MRYRAGHSSDTWQMLLALAAAVCLAVFLLLVPGSLGSMAFADDASSSASASSASQTQSEAPPAVSHANAPQATDPFADAAPVDLDDGLYQVEVALEGGSGRASVNSPAELEVFDGRGVVKLVWSSSSYDYMVVANKKYLTSNAMGKSTFVIPVTAYDTPMPVIGDTTAMSEAHEVSYTLTVKLDTAQPLQSSASSSAASAAAGASGSNAQASGASSANAAASSTDPSSQQGLLTWPWIVFIVCVIASAVCIGITIGIVRGYRNR